MVCHAIIHLIVTYFWKRLFGLCGIVIMLFWSSAIANFENCKTRRLLDAQLYAGANLLII